MNPPDKCPHCGSELSIYGPELYVCGSILTFTDPFGPVWKSALVQSYLCQERVARQKAEKERDEARKEVEEMREEFNALTAKAKDLAITERDERVALEETRRKLEEAEKRWECLKKMYQLKEPKKGGAS